ncbi:MAG TPA: T9SS type A sorting domain-containing protein [Ignavibacteria bacterium]
MKKIIFFLILGLFISTTIYARIITITVGPGLSRTFVPSSVTDAVVGDTVKWVWDSGIHTTTSVTVPAGAATWDAPINSTSTSFSYVIQVPGTYNYECTFHVLMGMTGNFVATPSVGIRQIETVANKFELSQNFPNPFNPVTSIKFSIQEKSFVKLNIYDINGRLMTNLVNNNLSAGEYKYDFNAGNLSSGIYFYRIEADNLTGNTGKFMDTKQMVLIK